MKAQRDEGGGKILLGELKGNGAVMLRPIMFQSAEVWISSALPCIYLYILQLTMCILNSDLRKIRLATHVPGRNYRVSRGVFVVP